VLNFEIFEEEKSKELIPPPRSMAFRKQKEILGTLEDISKLFAQGCEAMQEQICIEKEICDSYTASKESHYAEAIEQEGRVTIGVHHLFLKPHPSSEKHSEGDWGVTQ
jgi:hypothetical protein